MKHDTFNAMTYFAYRNRDSVCAIECNFHTQNAYKRQHKCSSQQNHTHIHTHTHRIPAINVIGKSQVRNCFCEGPFISIYLWLLITNCIQWQSTSALIQSILTLQSRNARTAPHHNSNWQIDRIVHILITRERRERESWQLIFWEWVESN